mgnify:CR=1 FL=1
MLDSRWTRVGLLLDSRWTGFDLFSVHFVYEFSLILDSS